MCNIKSYHTLSYENCLQELNSDINGLSSEDVKNRTNKFGKNKLREAKKKSLLSVFFGHMKDIMIIILGVAAIISAFLHEITDTIIIFIVILLNAIIGTVQESKSEKALEALKKMASPSAKIKRDGIITQIDAVDLVPGDIVLLDAGDRVPADLRLIESASLKIEESSLTGESEPVEKTSDIIENKDIPIADRKNLAFMNSTVTYGRGTGVVIGTGMQTEMGKIAEYLSEPVKETTPLQIKLKELGKYISIAVLGLCVFIFIVGILSGRDPVEMFLTAISLAVAAIPEGLPAIVTIVLAIGVQKMATRRAIVRKLPAVETLGCTQVICSDKTGTLTQNKMTVTKLYVNNNEYEASSLNDSTMTDNIKEFIELMVLCNDSSIDTLEDGLEKETGDPTETALVRLGINNSIIKRNISNRYPRRDEIPFDSERKLMSTLNQFDKSFKLLVKGAPDELINRCTHILFDDKVHELTSEIKEKILSQNLKYAEEAIRVLGTAYREFDTKPKDLKTETSEQDLIFVGLVGMIDPPREEAKLAVNLCRSAGITPVMITGDHMITGTAIAKKIGIADENSKIMSGMELDQLSDDELFEAVPNYSVYARVSPEHKVRIVEAWQKHNKIVAMTGDGVNDAPALKKADIGIGMGITGTDVSKSVADMVLSDDNFATIVTAVGEGRKIFNNIRKAVQFLLSANIGEVLTLFIATFLGWPILLPIHILWINLVTDTFPALALGVEKADSDIMEQPPRDAKLSIFAGRTGKEIIYQGILESILTLSAFALAYFTYDDIDIGRTIAFITLGLIQLFHVFNVRSEKSLFKIGLLSNKMLCYAFIFSAFLQISVATLPFLRGFFHCVPLNLTQWLIALGFSFVIIPVMEIIKLCTSNPSK